MSRQFDLFGGVYPERPGAVRDCDTSEAAADSLDEDTLSRLRKQIFEFIKERGKQGATCDEVEVALALRHQTASARIRELALGGLLFDSGDRRDTRSQRPARVYLTFDPSTRCAQCQGTPDGKEEPYGLILLHKQCKPHWIRDHG